MHGRHPACTQAGIRSVAHARRFSLHGISRLERIPARVRALGNDHKPRGARRMINGYMLWKIIHVLSATILMGTGIGIAFFCWFGYRRATRMNEIGTLRSV